MKLWISVARSATFAGCGILLAADPAWAGNAGPGPVLGAGAPALALIAGGYWLIRRRRRA
jgi:LPXTG-motif cell wall-anchored protein